MNKIGTNLRMFLWMTFLTGIVYPLLITGIAQLTMKQKADGDIIVVKNKIIGSRLIAQKFEQEKYFWGRPSAVDYNPTLSGGSNLGPTSAALAKLVVDRREKILRSHSVPKDKIPAELLFASGSGLDPDISLFTAYFQIERIAKARSMKNEDVKNLIDRVATKQFFNFFGKPSVNVLVLNKSLDEFTQK